MGTWLVLWGRQGRVTKAEEGECSAQLGPPYKRGMERSLTQVCWVKMQIRGWNLPWLLWKQRRKIAPGVLVRKDSSPGGGLAAGRVHAPWGRAEVPPLWWPPHADFADICSQAYLLYIEVYFYTVYQICVFVFLKINLGAIGYLTSIKDGEGKEESACKYWLTDPDLTLEM